METFIFNSCDFHFKVQCQEGRSKFDVKLGSSWNLKIESGNIFWYKLNIRAERIIDHKFLLQLNTDRANLKRQPADIQRINQAFDQNGFNFNKVKEEEKLFVIKHEANIFEGPLENLILVNVSPLEKYHILLVPEPPSCHPQILTERSLNLAVQLCLLSDSSYFRIGFNSLGAYASVNHLHFHGYYLEREMYLEFCSVKHIAGPCFSIPDYPAKGFVFQIQKEDEISSIVKEIIKLVQLLQHENTPHNVFITHGISFESADLNLSNNVRNNVRIYIWARKPSWGMKELSAFNIAVCELFGHMVIKNEKDYESLTSDEIMTTFDDITREPFENILPKVVAMF